MEKKKYWQKIDILHNAESYYIYVFCIGLTFKENDNDHSGGHTQSNQVQMDEMLLRIVFFFSSIHIYREISGGSAGCEAQQAHRCTSGLWYSDMSRKQ